MDIFIVVYNRKARRVNYIRFLCFHCYHLVDASAGGLLVRDSLIPIDSAGVLDIFIVVYYRQAVVCTKLYIYVFIAITVSIYLMRTISLLVYHPHSILCFSIEGLRGFWSFLLLSSIFQLYRDEFIGGGNWNTRRIPPTYCKSLTNFKTHNVVSTTPRHERCSHSQLKKWRYTLIAQVVVYQTTMHTITTRTATLHH